MQFTVVQDGREQAAVLRPGARPRRVSVDVGHPLVIWSAGFDAGQVLAGSVGVRALTGIWINGFWPPKRVAKDSEMRTFIPARLVLAGALRGEQAQ
jgi:hypothetical protein